MLCPLDKTPLVMSERQNIEIDYCPTCRGVWLDRGELDKIIERSGDSTPQASPEPRPRDAAPAPFGGHDTQGYGHHKKRRKNFLEELFD
ncbi:MAG: zf-TFIIB domain-containing protein [Pseudomonadota bacterium]|nr:zf-TFIIB domain-containing protein [Pseudomonadota bacterium]